MTKFLWMMKYLIATIAVFLLAFLAPALVSAQSNQSLAPTSTGETVKVIVFVRNGCQHCAEEEAFWKDVTAKRSDITVEYFRLENPDQRKVWEDFTARVQSAKVTPLTIIGTSLTTGFDKSETTGADLLKLVDQAKSKKVPTDLNAVPVGGSVAAGAACPEDGSGPCLLHPEKQPLYVSIPFVGRINVQQYPLLALSVILGFIDGFNPCAMWVLVTFLLILLQLGSRKKMFVFAGMFIFAEAVMYFLILTVWFKTWDFVKLDGIVTPIIGMVAIGSGLFFLREWRKGSTECSVVNLDERSKTKERLKKLVQSKFTVFTLIGILALAFSVNIIEFACSIGIPQTFTKVLELNQLPVWSVFGYLLVYILFYMVDDLVVFGIALYCMDKIHLTAKYSQWCHLIGGALMIVLGLLLLFKPGLLMFT